MAENQQRYRVSISRSKVNKGVLIFHSTIPKDDDRNSKLSVITSKQQGQLIEDIRLFLASKDMPFEGIKWPLDRILIEGVLPIDSHLCEQTVDDKAKQVVFTIVGINAIIRKSLGSSTSHKEGSQTK